MPYSIIVDGKVLDLRFKRLGNGLQAIYFDDLYFGQVGDMGRNMGWCAISKDPYPFMPVYGFKTRLAAVKFVLKLAGH
jgi:hypothetical protein